MKRAAFQAALKCRIFAERKGNAIQIIPGGGFFLPVLSGLFSLIPEGWGGSEMESG